MNDLACKVFAKSGATAENIEELLQMADNNANIINQHIEFVAIHLGTNDLSRLKGDPDSVITNITSAITKVREHYPDLLQIGICSLPPRKGKSVPVENFNANITRVNSFLSKFASRKDDIITFIDNTPKLLGQNKHAVKAMYNSNDKAGLHYSEEGKREIAKSICETLCPPSVFRDILVEASRKRKMSVRSATPSSLEKPECKRPDLGNHEEETIPAP